MLSQLSPVRLFVTLWTVARQVPLSKGFSRQDYWRGLPGPPPEDVSHPGIESSITVRFFITEPPGMPWSKADDKYNDERLPTDNDRNRTAPPG